MSEEKTLSEAIKILSDFVRGNDIEDHPLPCERYSLAQIQQALAARDRLIEQLGDALERISDMTPVTAEMTTAHEMGSEADTAIAAYREWKEGQDGHQV